MSLERLIISGTGDSRRIEGELSRDNSAVLHDWGCRIAATVAIRELDLAGLDIMDAAGIAAAVEVIRMLSTHSPVMSVNHAPHLLAHTLYRIGLLETGSHIVLVDPRQEEPYG